MSYRIGYLLGYIQARKHLFTVAYWHGYIAGKVQ